MGAQRLRSQRRRILLAGLTLPPAAVYEGFPIAEDGIGLVRRFEDGFARTVGRRRASTPGGALTGADQCWAAKSPGANRTVTSRWPRR